MEGINKKTLKEKLIAERNMLQKRLQEEEQRLEPERVRNPDRADLAWSYDQRQRVSAMQARTEKHIEEIEDALERMQDGTYGICTNCGEEIYPGRLEAIPWAELCIKCQEKQER